MNNEEDVKKSLDGDKGDNKLPVINGNNRNQFFDLEDFNSEDKEQIKNDDNHENIGDITPTDNKNGLIINTSDKLKQKYDDNDGSHKNGTVTGSDAKRYSMSKDSVTKKGRRPSDSQNEISDKNEDVDQDDATKDEIDHKKSNSCIKCNPKLITFLNKLLENSVYITFMMIITIYALFGDDFRLLLAPKSADEVFWSITSVAMALFLIELIMASIAQKDYFLGFYFWLDFIATISLITDIGWIYNEMTGGGDIDAENASQASSLARAGRSARIGTRAGRIVRLVRLIRIVKLYKHASKALNSNVTSEDDLSKEELEQIQSANAKEDAPQESHVGQKLSDLTTRRVIVIVLIMMFSIPILSLDTYRDTPNSFKYGLQLIARYDDEGDTAGSTMAFDLFLSEHESTRNPVVSVNADGTQWDDPGLPLDDLRTIEVLIATTNGDTYVSVHDNRDNIRLSAGLSIGQTCFICLVLTLAAMCFSSTTNKLVINPIESMIHKVRKIAKNPLEAAQEEENQALAFERFMQAEARKGRGKKDKKKDKEAPYETVILESTIVKIGALLAIGFGEAGSNIIAQNMEKSNGEVDPMIPGKKCVAFFGFCDIRQFTDTTEILQEEVMVFVNEIGEIVHSVVDSYAGAANKNIGDAFLLVWKLPDEDTEFNPKLKNLVVKKTHKSGCMAEMACTAFVKTFAEINKSRKLYKYRSYEKLNARMPNYSVKMGFGLHVGWAIEGAIGSDFKIDVSYLSPSVKLSDELEASTKLFGTPLLMSGFVADLMGDEMKAKCRQVDTVTIPGNSGKFKLFTCDLDFNLVDLEEEKKRVLTPMEEKLKRVKARLKRDRDRKKTYEGSIKIVNKFELDEDITKMREPFTPKFYEEFNKGFNYYIEGNWDSAREILEKMEEIRGTADGPSMSLIRVMQEHNYKAPADWEGWRELD